MSRNDRAAPPLGLARILRAGLDVQRRRAQAFSRLEVFRATDKRSGGDDRLRPCLPAQTDSFRTSED